MLRGITVLRVLIAQGHGYSSSLGLFLLGSGGGVVERRLSLLLMPFGICRNDRSLSVLFSRFYVFHAETRLHLQRP